MNETTFWNTIALLDWSNAGDDEAVLRPALEALIAMPVDQICGFDDLLAAKLFALDTREHCRHCYALRARLNADGPSSVPRYAGDVADPRGGVRHVMPGKGNCLVPEPPSLRGPGPVFIEKLLSRLDEGRFPTTYKGLEERQAVPQRPGFLAIAALSRPNRLGSDPLS